MTADRLAPEDLRTRTFTRVVRGYRRREVRRLLERAAADLSRFRNGLDGVGPGEHVPLTPEEIEEARFQPALGGYEMGEVDEFLDRVMVELERAAREPQRQPSALLPPPRAPSPAGPPSPVPTAPPSRTAPSPGPPSPPSPEPAMPPPSNAGPLPRSAGPPPPTVAPPPTAPPLPPSAPAAAEPAPPAPPPPPPEPRTAPPPRPLTPAQVETHSFDRGAPGYLPTHVDLFLARAARALAGRDGGEPLTRWDVLRQRFPLGPRGYATSEVDAFLVQLAAQFPEPDPAVQQDILRKLQGD
jgi:DivIVA domain-containing protein